MDRINICIHVHMHSVVTVTMWHFNAHMHCPYQFISFEILILIR